MKAEISIVRGASRDKETEEIRIITRLAMGKTITATMTPEAFAQALTGKSDLPADLRLRNVELSIDTLAKTLQNAPLSPSDKQGRIVPINWINHCDKVVPAALRYLAEKPRPEYGTSSYNTEHLYDLARQIEVTAERHAAKQDGPTFDEWCARNEQKPIGWVREEMEAAFNAGRAAAPEGYILMPLDPTPEMLEEICLTKGFTENALRARYAALLAAGQKAVQDGD